MCRYIVIVLLIVSTLVSCEAKLERIVMELMCIWFLHCGSNDVGVLCVNEHDESLLPPARQAFSPINPRLICYKSLIFVSPMVANVRERASTQLLGPARPLSHCHF